MTSKKNYNAVAAVIRRHVEASSLAVQRAVLLGVARDIAQHFKSDNPNFVMTQFLSACFPHGVDNAGVPKQKED